jgi:hypothetical protein
MNSEMVQADLWGNATVRRYFVGACSTADPPGLIVAD